MNPSTFDRALGDPLASHGAFSFRSAVDLDEREEFPSEASDALDALGLPRHYVPTSLGGALHSFEGLACILRAIARRDVTLAVGHGKTLLGSQPAFLGGDAAARRDVAARVLAGEGIALGLTERGNGSDLLASSTHASAGSPRTLTGEKWLINNATRAPAMCVFARTRPEGGPRGFSLLLADKRAMGGAYTLLPKIRTHGIRGADISGIRFESAPCPSPPIGGEGAALAVVLKTFVVTRSLIASVAVGAVDSALRIVLAFARDRPIYGSRVVAIPQARDLLSNAVARHLHGECVALAGARMLQASPGQACFWSSVLKVHVPTRSEETLRDLALVYGARHYLREGDAAGMFQKILRDVGILSVFDGNVAVNLANIAVHGGAIERGSTTALPEGAFRLADASEPLPELDGAKLAIVASRVVGAEALAEHALSRVAGRAHDATLRPLLEQLASDATAIRREMAATPPAAATGMTTRIVTLASRYADLAASALAACTFVHAGGDAPGPLSDGDWLVVSLARTLGVELAPTVREACGAGLLDGAFRMIDERNPISIVPPRHDLQGTP